MERLDLGKPSFIEDIEIGEVFAEIFKPIFGIGRTKAYIYLKKSKTDILIIDSTNLKLNEWIGKEQSIYWLGYFSTYELPKKTQELYLK